MRHCKVIPSAGILGLTGTLLGAAVLRLALGGTGVEGLSASKPPFFFFLLSNSMAGSSSSTISGKPDSMPASVRSSSSRSRLNLRSLCSIRLISRYNASSSSTSRGVRLSRFERYRFRVSSRSLSKVKDARTALLADGSPVQGRSFTRRRHMLQ